MWTAGEVQKWNDWKSQAGLFLYSLDLCEVHCWTKSDIFWTSGAYVIEGHMDS